MRVLIWSQYFWPENFHINAVAQALHAQNIEVTVLTGKPNYPEGEIYDGYKASGIHREEYAGIEVIRIPIRQRDKSSRKGLVLNYLSFIFSGYLFAPYALRGKKFDVVFVYAPSPLLQALPAIYIAWLKSSPLVLWVQDIWPEALVATGFIKNKWLLQLVGLAVRYIYRFSDSILIQSEGFRASVEKWIRKKDKIHYFPNSAEGVQVNQPASKQGILVAKGIASSFSVVFAGNIGTAQSCETIVEAANLLRDIPSIKFYLVGGGRMAEAIARSVEDSQLNNVVMTGQVPVEDMDLIYASSSVLLLTLRDDPALSLTIPSKLQGYLAAGKPVIVSCNGEAVNVVNCAQAGLTCRAGDAVALAEAVMALYEMTPDERELLGKNGRAHFDAHYYLHNRVTELVEYFKGVAVS